MSLEIASNEEHRSRPSVDDDKDPGKTRQEQAMVENISLEIASSEEHRSRPSVDDYKDTGKGRQEQALPVDDSADGSSSNGMHSLSGRARSEPSLPGQHDFRRIEFGTLAEQQDEAMYDGRSFADDDLIKGRIQFPKDKLYGRDEELTKLHSIFSECSRGTRKSQSVFLGGYSGTGKSALVAEFTRQLVHGDTASSPDRCIQVTGKCTRLKSSNPLSAILEAMTHLAGRLLGGDEADLPPLLERLAKVDIHDHSADARTLVDVIPQLSPILYRDKQQAPNNSTASGMCQDLTYFKLVFLKFLRAICSKVRPLIMFIDDLQWASSTSLEVISALCSNESMEYFLFIGAYRPNEVGEEHPLVKIMSDIALAIGTDCVHHIELANLSQRHIGQFIADSVERSDDVGEVCTLVDVIYSKTLGNIFFVKQALEELVRRNALYYDMMTFQWDWGNVGRVDLEKYLLDDVVAMVRSKISGLPVTLQKALTLAAFTSNVIDLWTLQALLEVEGIFLSPPALARLLHSAIAEGVLVKIPLAATSVALSGTKNRTRVFKFAHDRIQEAASTLVPPGKDRDQMLVRISNVLADRGLKDPKNDWMLFVAVNHLNSVAREHLDDQTDVARFNFHATKLATRKASFPLACKLARIGVGYLDKETCWKRNYDLCLDFYNLLAQTENDLGNFDEALLAVDQVLQNATSIEDQASAHDTRIAVIFGQNDQNHVLALRECLETLKLYGVHLPIEPTKKDLLTEQIKLRAALGSRPLSALTELPVTRDDSMMKLLQRASILAQMAHNVRMAMLIAKRAVRIAVKQGAITKYLPLIASALGLPLRMKGKYDQACACADTAVALLHRFPEEGRTQIARIKLTLLSNLLLLRQPFASAIGDMIDFHWVLISHGMPWMGLSAARQASLCFIAGSLPLHSLLEPKLLQFQELATDMGRMEFTASFKCIRWFLNCLNAESKPATVNGVAFDGEAMLVSLEGNAKCMVERDLNLLRLQLAYIFDDEAGMEDALQTSSAYPTFDISILRQHLRLAYVGFAGLTLGRRQGYENKKRLSWGLAALNHFKKLDRFGSPNARPIYRCLRAVHEPSRAAFDEAIIACSNANLINLAARMNELCARFIEKQSTELKDEYLRKALWLYSDWGAEAKVNRLKEQHDFLRRATREGPPDLLHNLLKTTNVKGLMPVHTVNSSSKSP